MSKIQYLYKTGQGIPGIYAQKFGDILQNMNFSRYYRNRGKFIYGFDPNIILYERFSDMCFFPLRAKSFMEDKGAMVMESRWKVDLYRFCRDKMLE